MNEWFYAKNGQQNGPVTLEQLRQLAQSGGLDAKDLVWNSGMKDWEPAGQVEGLFSAPSTTAAPVSDPSNPYAAPQSAWTEPAPTAGTALPEIIAGSEPIDPVACVKRGFDLAKRHLGKILLMGLAYFGVVFSVNIVMTIIQTIMGATLSRGDVASHDLSGVQIVVFIVTLAAAMILNVFMMLGFTRVGLNLVSGKEVVVGQLFGEGRKVFRVIGAGILFCLMVSIGYVLFIVPGVYLALRYGQFTKAIVDRDMGVFDAFSYSSALTTNNKLQIFVLGLLCMLVMMAGMLACGIGVIFAAPVVWLSSIVAYRWMQHGHRATLD